MIKIYLQNGVIGLFLVLSIILVSSSQVLAARSGSCHTGSGSVPSSIFVPWYKYLPSEGSQGKGCRPVTISKDGSPAVDNKKTDWARTISAVAIAVIDTLTRISAIIALGFIIWGAIQYITSQGEPEGLQNAKNTIMNALIGLIIVILAIGIVQFIGNTIAG